MNTPKLQKTQMTKHKFKKQWRENKLVEIPDEEIEMKGCITLDENGKIISSESRVIRIKRKTNPIKKIQE